MPKKSKYPGVERRGDKLRIWFIWQGKKVHEPHPAPPTAAGLAAAARDRARIDSQIDAGTFLYHDWFPGSPRATRVIPSFNDVAEIWVARVRPDLAPMTLSRYVQKLNRYWLPPLAPIPLPDISTGHLRDIAASLTDIAPKTFNDSLTPLRGVFETGVDDGIITVNPAAKIKSRRRQKQQPDPLTKDEMLQVLDWMKAKAPDWYPWFAIAFDTGMRTSEMIALQWSDIDQQAGYLRVERAYVAQKIKAVKTFVARDVEFGNLTRTALGLLKPVTFMAGELVFLDPATGKIINDDKPPRLVWTRALKSLGIRHRPAYNTRHTFATLALMIGDGINIGWISKQLGHSSIKMTTDHYATWIQRMDRGEERRKLDSVFI